MPLGTLAAGAKILGGLGGLFKKGNSAGKNSRSAIMGQAKGARDAAEQFGFNPLTLLAASSGIGPSESTPPLASVAMLTDGLQGLDDVVSGENERTKERERLQDELLRLEVERARAGGAGAIGARRYAAINAPALSAPDMSIEGAATARRPNDALSWLNSFFEGSGPKREEVLEPNSNHPGFWTMWNDWTGGPVVMPGDSGELPDVSELVGAAVVAGPQVARNWGDKLFGAGRYTAPLGRVGGLHTAPLEWLYHGSKDFSDYINRPYPKAPKGYTGKLRGASLIP